MADDVRMNNGYRSADESPTGNWLGYFMDRVGTLFKVEVPLGYEDESGFHYGREPMPVPPEQKLAS